MPVPENPFPSLVDVSLPAPFESAFAAEASRWAEMAGVRRLWAKDAGLWTGGDEDRWLDWLDIVADELAVVDELYDFTARVEAGGYRHLVLLGMGGSSMGPEVLHGVFGSREGLPPLHVVDSTDPDQIRATEARLDLARTLFIVASKSGSTLEPNLLKAHFFARVKAVVGAEQAGRHFVAITDPGSQLESVAQADGFQAVFLGRPRIGGRYSVLSHFGMVPAAGIGMDVTGFLERAALMVAACRETEAAANPGLQLGLILGVAHRLGRDKLTFTASPAFAGLGAWVEQLVAESTGKGGKAIIPLAEERLGPPEVYGEDRLFVHVALRDEADAGQQAALDALAAAGHPVVRITVPEHYDLGQEFFRWEFATAVAGAVMEIHPFDQPDVEASKIATRALAEAYERDGTLPASKPLACEAGLCLYADDANTAALRAQAGGDEVADLLRAHLARIGAGDYFALLAYLNRLDPGIDEALQAIRHAVRDRHRVATCLGYGPRFLHSTGQAYKGGANNGVFLQITADPEQDLPVPGHRYSFGVIESAQALGDLQVLQERGRRVLRVHLGADIPAGLARLRALVSDG